MAVSEGLLSVYFRLPPSVQDAAVSAYGYRLRQLRYGRIHDAYLAELRRRERFSAEAIRNRQLAELTQLLRYARATVPLYQRKGLPEVTFSSFDDLRRLPLLRKEELRAPRDEVVSKRYRGRRLLEIHTGGTTGKPLSIYCDRPTLQRNYAFFSRFREWAGTGAGARSATFAGRTVVGPDQSRPPYWRRNGPMNQWIFSSYHIGPETVPAYVEGLRRCRPDLIDSYPSSLRPIARYLVEHGVTDLRPRAVITSSETLDDGTRELIEMAFGCRVFDHYGAAEMAALVTQCERGSYHVNPEFGVVEILREGEPVRPGESGEIVATGFINPVMPLVRYATGDRAVLGAGGCPCGRPFPTLARIEGRLDDVIVTPDGRLIGRLDPIFKKVDSIFETRIVQHKPDGVRVEVVVDNGFGPRQEGSLRRELARRLGGAMAIEIVRVPSIPRTPAGKLRAVVNRVGEKGEGAP